MIMISEGSVAYLNENKRTNSVEHYLFACFLFFLPFSQALTIQLFFPLKISELALIIYIFVKLIKINSAKLPVSTPFLFAYLFSIIVFTSFIINLVSYYGYPLNVAWVRISPMGDGLLKFIYLILAISCAVISYNDLKAKPTLMKYFFWGATAACSYCWYLFFSGILHIPVIKLPGMDSEPQYMPLSFATIIRCGTAKEGNFMALFLFVSGIISFHFGKKKQGLYYLLAIVTTFSTVAIVCVIAYFILTAIYNKNISKAKVVLAITFTGVALTAATIFSTDFRTVVVNKIFGTAETVDNANDIQSKLDRLNTADVGLQIFSENPYWGVGLSNYSLHYDHFNELARFDQIYKRIPNNVYIEILSESGAFALIVFLLIIISSIFMLKGNHVIHLRIGLFMMLIYLFAFPTYTMLFIWVFIALVQVERNNANKIDIVPALS